MSLDGLGPLEAIRMRLLKDGIGSSAELKVSKPGWLPHPSMNSCTLLPEQSRGGGRREKCKDSSSWIACSAV